jgi:hypothetical protein
LIVAQLLLAIRRKIFDGVEKRFGFTKRVEELTQRARRGRGGVHGEGRGEEEEQPKSTVRE